jgi:hypothetical protein
MKGSVFMAMFALRPYRARPSWMDNVELAFGLVVLLGLAVSAVVGIIGYFKDKKREKHAALERVLARQARKPK